LTQISGNPIISGISLVHMDRFYRSMNCYTLVWYKDDVKLILPSGPFFQGFHSPPNKL